jgi:hypothetical protein
MKNYDETLELNLTRMALALKVCVCLMSRGVNKAKSEDRGVGI